jgi:tetratricopeptide (TPR) repeat protein
LTDESGAGMPARDEQPSSGADCPEATVLAAYLDGTLDETERRRVGDHVSRCDDCYAVVSGSLKDISVGPSVGRVRAGRWIARSPQWLLPVAAALVVAVGGGAMWRRLRPVDPYREAVQPLVEAVGERRFFEPRLTGGFRFGPRQTPVRSSGAQPENWELFAAANQIRNQQRSHSTPEARRALAAASLVVGSVDEAVSSLQEQARTRPTDAAVFTDLSAALLVRATDPKHSADVPAALDAANKALALEPTSAEALHNKALALESLGLSAEALQAWRALARGSDAWALEAERHARDLEEGLRPQERPRSDWDPVAELQHWAQAERDSVEPSVRGATAAKLEEYRRQTGDTFFTAVFDGAIHADPADRAATAAGARLIALAEGAANADQWRESLAASQRARDVLHRARSPLDLLAAVHAGTASYYLGDLGTSASILTDVLASAPKEYVSVCARAHWMLGLVEFVEEHPFAAAIHHADAIRLYANLNKPDLAVFVKSLLAQDLYAQGQTDAAWQRWREVVADSALETLSPRRRFTVLWEMARRLLDTAPFAARQLLDRAVDVALTSGDRVLSAAALVRRGRAALRAGDIARARDDEHRAGDLVRQLPEDLRGRWVQDLGLLAGEIQQHRGVLAERDLEDAYRYFADRGHWLQAIEVAEQLAELAANRGELPLAVDRIRESLEHVAATRTSARDALERSQYQERFERLYARYIVWLARAGHSHDAALLALDPSADPRHLQGHQGTSIHTDRRVVVLTESEGRAFGWLLDGAGGGGSPRVRECLANASVPPVAEVGTTALIARCVRSTAMDPTGELTVVPSGRLRWQDWAAVLHSLDLEFPDLNVDLGVVVRDRNRLPRPTNARGVLAVLAFHEKLALPGLELPPLHLVQEEIDAVRRCHREALTVQGTPRDALSMMGSASIVHVAGHLLHEPTGANALPVSDRLGHVGFLDSRDVANARWEHPPELVFLNACISGPGRSPSPLPMAEAFLLAGAADVIATTRPVTDAVALDAAKAFYASLPSMRSARLARMLRSMASNADGDHPPYVALSAVRVVQQGGGER